jgi:hypothetical protein
MNSRECLKTPPLILMAGLIRIVFFFLNPCDSFAAEVNKSPIQSGLGIIFGVKTVNIGREVIFSHDTYYKDDFLPNYNIPGSAGKTSVGPDLEYSYYGVGYQRPLSDRILLNASLGVLKDFGTNRERHRNDNDTRLYPYASFVYSDANIGGFSSVGLSYNLKHFFVGAEVEYNVIKLTHGLDRYDKDHLQGEEFLWIFSGGPRIGYYLFKNLSIEASYHAGKYPSCNAMIHWWFFK